MKNECTILIERDKYSKNNITYTIIINRKKKNVAFWWC